MRGVRAIALAAATAAAACDRPATPPSPPPAERPAERPAALPRWDPAAAVCTLRGVVRLAPGARRDAPADDPSVPEDRRAWERREVNPDGTLPHAFVHVVAGPSLAFTGLPVRDLEVDQAGMRFQPHVGGVSLGGAVTFRNSDPAVHNVHVQSPLLDRWNPTQVPGGTTVYRPERAAFDVSVSCDLHSWMGFRLHVVAHPFFAVSERGTGAFEIAGLVPGRHRFRVRHETWGRAAPVEFEVELRPGANSTDATLGD